MDPLLRERQKKTEFQLVLEFVGFRNLVILGLMVSLYLYSGYYNYMQGMNPLRAFSPYYALHFHNGSRIIESIFRSIGQFFSSIWNAFLQFIVSVGNLIHTFLQTYIDPFIQQHPLLGFSLFFAIGIIFTAVLLFITFWSGKKVIILLNPARLKEKQAKNIEKEEYWNFDPRRKPSDDQLKTLQKSLERLVLRAPAMGGTVPKNADLNIREMALRNRDSEYNYRCAIYVMGPIKGSKFDNSYEIPLALDQIKKISHSMGLASTYEILPLDMVLLRNRKGTKNMEVDPETAPINLGKAYPVGIVEKVMTSNRNYFIWDNRAAKSKTGYGLHGH